MRPSASDCIRLVARYADTAAPDDGRPHRYQFDSDDDDAEDDDGDFPMTQETVEAPRPAPMEESDEEFAFEEAKTEPPKPAPKPKKAAAPRKAPAKKPPAKKKQSAWNSDEESSEDDFSLDDDSEDEFESAPKKAPAKKAAPKAKAPPKPKKAATKPPPVEESVSASLENFIRHQRDAIDTTPSTRRHRRRPAQVAAAQGQGPEARRAPGRGLAGRLRVQPRPPLCETEEDEETRRQGRVRGRVRVRRRAHGGTGARGARRRPGQDGQLRGHRRLGLGGGRVGEQR